MVNLSLCNSFEPSLFCNKRDSHDEDEEHLILIFYEKVQMDLNANATDFNLIFNAIIQEATRVTESRFAFMARCSANGEKHQIITLTNSAWDFSTFEFYDAFRTNKTFHRFIRYFREPTRRNHYKHDPQIPRGHPIITRYMIVPQLYGDCKRVYILLCNKKKGYTSKDLATVERLMRVAGNVIQIYEFRNEK